MAASFIIPTSLHQYLMEPCCTTVLQIGSDDSWLFILREEFYSLVNIIEQKFNAVKDAALRDTLRLFISPSTLSSTLSVRRMALVRYFTSPRLQLCASVTKLHIDLDITAEPKEWMRVLAELFSNFKNSKHLHHHISSSTLQFLLSFFGFLSQRNRMGVGEDSDADYSKHLPHMNSISFPDVNFASLRPSNANLLKNLQDCVTIRLADLNVSPITWPTFENCHAMSTNRISALANVGVRPNLNESTCKNCDIPSGGLPHGWRIVFPSERV